MIKRLVVLIITLLLLTSCFTKIPLTLRVGTSVWLGYEPLYLARKKQFIDTTNIHLVEFLSSAQVIQAFRNDMIDAAALTLDEALLLAQNGEQLTIVLVLDISNGGDAIISQASMNNLADLQGKLIGTDGSAASFYLLHRALQIAQLDDNNFKTTFIDANNYLQTFLNHQVDALVTFEPTRSKLLDQGGHVLFDSSQIPNEIVDVLVVRSQFLKNYPDTVQQLIDGWYNALAYFNNHPKESAAIMSKRLNLSTAETLKAFQGIILPNAERNRQLLQTKPQPELYQIAKKMIKFMNQHQLLNMGRPVNPSNKDKTNLDVISTNNAAISTLFAPTSLHYQTSPQKD